jgi:hypothetical protein
VEAIPRLAFRKFGSWHRGYLARHAIPVVKKATGVINCKCVANIYNPDFQYRTGCHLHKSSNLNPKKRACEMIKGTLILFADEFPNEPIEFIKLVDYVCLKDRGTRYYLGWDNVGSKSIENNRKLRGIRDALLGDEYDDRIKSLHLKPLKLAWIVKEANFRPDENTKKPGEQPRLDDLVYANILQQYIKDIYQLKIEVQVALGLSHNEAGQALERLNISYTESRLREEDNLLQNHLQEVSKSTGKYFNGSDISTLIGLAELQFEKNRLRTFLALDRTRSDKED